MSITQQAGVFLRALELGGLPAAHVIRWTDKVIMAEESPPVWLLDLSILDPTRISDMLHLLHEHADHMECRELDIWILAHLFFAGQLAIEELFKSAFQACIMNYDAPKAEPFERLADILCSWDQLDFPDLNQGDWRERATAALNECQQACGELNNFLSDMFAHRRAEAER